MEKPKRVYRYKRYFWMSLIGKIGDFPEHMAFFANKADAIKDVKEYIKDDPAWLGDQKKWIGYQTNTIYSSNGRSASIICYERHQAILEGYIDEKGNVLPL